MVVSNKMHKSVVVVLSALQSLWLMMKTIFATSMTGLVFRIIYLSLTIVVKQRRYIVAEF